MCTLIILLSALTNKIPKGKSQIWDFCVFRNPKFGNSENTKIPNLGFSKSQIWDFRNHRNPKFGIFLLGLRTNPKNKSQKKIPKEIPKEIPNRFYPSV